MNIAIDDPTCPDCGSDDLTAYHPRYVTCEIAHVHESGLAAWGETKKPDDDAPDPPSIPGELIFCQCDDCGASWEDAVALGEAILDDEEARQ